MVTRRALIASGAAGLLALALSHPVFAAPPSPADPAGIVTAIYTRAAKGASDGEPWSIRDMLTNSLKN